MLRSPRKHEIREPLPRLSLCHNTLAGPDISLTLPKHSTFW